MNVKKIMVFIITVLFIISINISSFSAVSDFKGDLSKVDSTTQKTMKTTISTILGVTRNIGATVAVVILIVIGCKYMMASAGDRADIKKYAISYVIGAIILFGASGILTLLRTMITASIKIA